MRKALQLIGVCAVTLAVVHILWTGVITTSVHFGYRHRVFDVRKWDDFDARRAAISAFLDRFTSRRIYVGSSFTYGYPLKESLVFTNRQDSVNVSVMALSVGGIHDLIICGIERADTLIIEIPLVNTLSYPAYKLGECPPKPRVGLFRFFLAQPYGVGHLKMIWNSHTEEGREDNIRPAPPGHFPISYDKNAFAGQITHTLSRATTIAANVYAFVSPVYLPGVADSGVDPKVIREQIDFAIETCKSVPHVVCLDTSPFYDKREYWWNLTHLSPRGHQAMRVFMDTHIKN